MRRGLIALSPTELPDAVLDARAARLQAAMAEAGLDALLLYTNNTRTAAVSWLTGFVPYWSEGLVVLPRGGKPVLVVALSNRVKNWIEQTSRIAEVRHTPRIGLEAARLIAASRSDAALGIADLDGLPTGIADDLTEGGPALRLSDATGLFQNLRARPDPAEIALTAKAGWIAQSALAEASLQSGSLARTIAAVEAAARRQGAEEIYLAAAPDLDRDHRLRRIDGPVEGGARYALRATVAYKGSWVRMTRTVAPEAEEAAARLAQAAAGLPETGGFASSAEWLVETCRLAQPLEPIMGSRVGAGTAPAHGALVTVQARFEIGGKAVLIGAPALLGERGAAASLLVHPLFDKLS